MARDIAPDNPAQTQKFELRKPMDSLCEDKVNFRQNPRVLGRLPRSNMIYWELGVVNLTRTGSILVTNPQGVWFAPKAKRSPHRYVNVISWDCSEVQIIT